VNGVVWFATCGMGLLGISVSSGAKAVARVAFGSGIGKLPMSNGVKFTALTVVDGKVDASNISLKG